MTDHSTLLVLAAPEAAPQVIRQETSTAGPCALCGGWLAGRPLIVFEPGIGITCSTCYELTHSEALWLCQ